MVKYGKAICLDCMQETSEFMYYIAEDGLVVSVYKNRKGHYRVKSENIDKKDKPIHIIEKVKLKRGLPLEVTIAYDQKIVTLAPDKRICPTCYRIGNKIQYLPYSGYCDTYIIAVVGEPDAGKTAWCKSCAYYSNFARWSGENIRFEELGYTKEQLNATTLQETGLIRQFSVIDKHGKTKANILEMDIPGEIVTLASQQHSQAYEQHKRRIDKADAFVYLVDGANNPLFTWEVKSHEAKIRYLFSNISLKKPVAVTVTKIDKIKAYLENHPSVELGGDTLMNKAYYGFQENGVYTRKDMCMKQVVDRHIIQKLFPNMENLFDKKRKNIGYFLISSGTENPYNTKVLDYENAINIYNPLEFLLRAKGIMEEREVG